MNGDEAFYHSVAERMVATGDWLSVQFLAERRSYDAVLNAPLQYWARATLIVGFGSNLWTIRILSALFGIATVLATWRLALALASRRTALLAALLLATTFQFGFLHSARTGELEPALACFMVLAAHALVRALDAPRGFLGHHLAIAVLANLKLPFAIVPVAASAAGFAVTPRARRRLGAWLATGLALLPLALAWQGLQALSLGEEYRGVLAALLGRASGETSEAGSGSPLANLGYYARVLAFGAYPYAYFYPVALAWVLGSLRDPTVAQRWRIVACFPLAVLAFYALVSQRMPWYVIPAYPFLSIFLARWLAGLPGRRPGVWETAGAVAALALAIGTRVDLAYNPFAMPAVLIPMDVAGRFGRGAVPLLGGAVIVLAAGLASWGLRRPGGAGVHRIVAAGVVIGLLGFGTLRALLPLRQLDHQSPLARVHAQIRAKVAGGEALDFPIELPPGHFWIVRYYFADDFEIVGAASGRGAVQGAGLRLVGWKAGRPR